MSDDKNEEPTQKKLDQAKEKGQIAVSRDLAKLATLVAVAETAFASESLWREAISSLIDASIRDIGKDFMPALDQMVMLAGTLLLTVFGIFFVMGVIVPIISNWGQFGVLFSAESVTPKFDKLNPVNGLKQLFSKKKLFELMLTMGKAGLIGWLVYTLAYGYLPNIISLSGGDPNDVFYTFIAIVHSIFHVVMVLCFLLGLIDFAVQKYAHKKELMMDMEEIKQENKDSEGDPMVKGQRKKLARQWANEAPVARTEDANAVVVNPTHFAVGMYYDAAEAMVPIVLCKGKDEIARAMIERARQCGIPVIRHVWLARTLYATCRPDMAVPKSSYEAVAHVYAVVQELMASGQTDKEMELEIHGEPPVGELPLS